MYEEILDTAEELFMKQGYNDTSTRQIANILNITQPNIYYHFKNKEEIYYEVMQRLAKEVGENLTQIAADETRNFNEKLLQMAFYLQKRHPFSLFMMMHDLQHTLQPEIAEKLFGLWERSYKQPFLGLFTQEQRIRATVEPDFAVRQLFILISANLDLPEASKVASLKKTMELFFYGILKK